MELQNIKYSIIALKSLNVYSVQFLWYGFIRGIWISDPKTFWSFVY